ncbi:hypothetical protein FEI14_09265 [Lacticaseibacillus zeae]|uniref:Uncharacterized protein n=1 Tax=Lacticaseibacillus zeae TaxID=57037 RepID=A0A5R8LUF1_LACZE|nr:hypothetical protein FEI14_09265 [Lacticaseibacillus zeae]
MGNELLAVPNSAISGQLGLERGGHDFEPAKTAVSKLGLVVGGAKTAPPTTISPLSPSGLRSLRLGTRESLQHLELASETFDNS